jgi:pimeloyl-ACP methyl ester carboxylesterase
MSPFKLRRRVNLLWSASGICLLSFVVLACGSKESPPTAPAVVTRTLKVVTGPGVTGSPTASTTAQSGTSIQYSFSSSSGFGRLRVQLDGADAAVSGSVSMTTDHTLAAVADSIITLSHSDSVAISSARAILTSSDPARELVARLDKAWSDQAALGTAAALGTINRVRTFGFSRSDAPAIHAANQKLAGQVFDIDIGENLALANRAAAQTNSAPSPNLPFAFIYINGIETTEPGAIDEMFEIRDLIAHAGLPDYTKPNYHVWYLYNASWTARDGESAACTIGAISVGLAGGLSALALVDAIRSACGFFADLTRAAADVAELLSSAPGSSLEATNLASLVASERRLGRGVILVGHSQGTLIAQNAMKLLVGSSSDFNVSLQRCTGFVSLAGPVPNGLVISHQKNLYVQGTDTKDIILLLPTTAGSKGIPTSLTAYTDEIAKFWKSLLIGNWTELVYGTGLHALHGYLSATPMRETIQQAVRDQVNAIRTDCVQTPASLRIVTQPSATLPNTAIDPPPSVEVRDAEGNRIGNSTAPITVSLPSSPSSLTGTKSVQALNGVAPFSDLKISAAGTYQLVFSSPGVTSTTSNSFTISLPPCTGAAVSVPFLVTGDLRAGTCDVYGAPGALFDFSTPSQRAIRIRVVNTAFTPRLGIQTRDRGQGQFFTYSSPGTNTMLALLEGGQYTASVAELAGALSTFTFDGNAVSESETGCEEVTMLRPTILTTGQSLSTGDCAFGSSYADKFAIGGSRPCRITMRSSSFDAYLAVYDRQGNLIASDDDGAGGTDARITLQTCYAGSDAIFLFGVHVYATSFYSGIVGPYSLTFEFDLPSSSRANSAGADESNKNGGGFASNVADSKPPNAMPVKHK